MKGINKLIRVGVPLENCFKLKGLVLIIKQIIVSFLISFLLCLIIFTEVENLVVEDIKINTYVISQIGDLWVSDIKYTWSYLRHYPKNNTFYDIERIKSLEDIQLMSIFIKNSFEYTFDGPDRLFDSFKPPDVIWSELTKSPPLKDDCDGFHIAMYYASQPNFNVRLLTLVTENIKDSHVVLLIKDEGNYYYLDYQYLSYSMISINNIVQHLQDRKFNRKKTKVIMYEISKWNGQKWESDNDF